MKKKKEKRDNLNVDEKEQLRKCEKKGKEAMCDNLNNDKKEHKNRRQQKIKQSVITLIIMKKTVEKI